VASREVAVKADKKRSRSLENSTSTPFGEMSSTKRRVSSDKTKDSISDFLVGGRRAAYDKNRH
jgi:hypothetical protein